MRLVGARRPASQLARRGPVRLFHFALESAPKCSNSLSMPKLTCPLLRAVCLAVGICGLTAQEGWAAAPYTESPGKEGNGDFTIGPDYNTDSDLTDKGNPKGKSFEFSMPLAESKIFKGDDTTLTPDKKPVRKERKIFVYVPAAYKDGTKAPILIIHDGDRKSV